MPTSQARLPARPGRHAHHHPRPDQVLRRLAAVRELRPRHPQAQDRLGVRAQRLRQVDADQHDRGADADRRGEILFDGKSLKDTKIGYVFQNYREAMFPWMRTIDNIAYPLKLEGKSKAEVDRRMEELVASFDVKFDLNRYPYELSGGQQQTASIMRALARRWPACRTR
jgi:energy-coupling factor transporter ATP-binding protein EcfA2